MPFLKNDEARGWFCCDNCRNTFLVLKSENEFTCSRCKRVYAFEGENVIVKKEPKIEEPKIEEPKIEEPKIEEPKIEEPVEKIDLTKKDKVLDLSFFD